MKAKIPIIGVVLFCVFGHPNAIAGGSEIAKYVAKIVIGVATGVASDMAVAKIKEEINENGETQVSGYLFEIQWLAPDGSYSGILTIDNQGVGKCRVTTPGGMSVDENMVMQTHGGNVIFNGSNPTYTDTYLPVNNYSPDRFRLVNTGQIWTIADTCDYQGNCSPVTVLRVGAF